MRERLAIHFAFASFAVGWGFFCLIGEGDLETLGATLVFTALSALIGWLSYSESGRGWSVLRTFGWTPLIAAAVGLAVPLIFDHGRDALSCACLGAVGSIVLFP